MDLGMYDFYTVSPETQLHRGALMAPQPDTLNGFQGVTIQGFFVWGGRFYYFCWVDRHITGRCFI